MPDTQPHALTAAEWAEVIALPEVRESWGLADETPEEFAASVYAVKFTFISGSPGYVGDLFVLQGDALSDAPPTVLTRDTAGNLQVHTY